MNYYESNLQRCLANATNRDDEPTFRNTDWNSNNKKITITEKNGLAVSKLVKISEILANMCLVQVFNLID